MIFCCQKHSGLLIMCCISLLTIMPLLSCQLWHTLVLLKGRDKKMLIFFCKFKKIESRVLLYIGIAYWQQIIRLTDYQLTVLF